MTQPITENEDFVVFQPILTSYFVKCSKHQKWDCFEPECQPDMEEKLEKLVEKIKTCTRQEPHVCGVNGPCNGWPKREILNPPNKEVWHVPVPGLANEEHTPVGFGAGPN